MTEYLFNIAILSVGIIELCFNAHRLIEDRAQRKADAEYAKMLTAGPEWLEEFDEELGSTFEAQL